MSISILRDMPQSKMPDPAKNNAVWLAFLRPITSQRRPYKGVKVHVASRYLMPIQYNKSYKQFLTHEVPSQLAWCDFLNSDDIEAITCESFAIS